jgi:mannosyltransferase OCH1-like enzyme
MTMNTRPWLLYNQTVQNKQLGHVGKIPKIIHQTWKDHVIPEKWIMSPVNWKRLHPDWLWLLWTDDDIREYIRTFHPQFVDLFNNFKYAIQMADAIRYFILYDMGGIYSDLDIVPKKNLSEYFNTEIDIYLVMSPNLNYFSNFFMVSSPKQPLWRYVWEAMQKELPSWVVGKHMEVMFSTGPSMFNQEVMQYNKIIGFLPRKLFAPVSVMDDPEKMDTEESAIMMLPGQSWCQMDSKVYNFFLVHRVKFIALSAVLSVLFIIFAFRKLRRTIRSR